MRAARNARRLDPVNFVEIDGHVAGGSQHLMDAGGAGDCLGEYGPACYRAGVDVNWSGVAGVSCDFFMVCGAVAALLQADGVGLVLSVAPGGKIVRRALRAARPSRVARGALNDVELGQARDYAALRGGTFKGAGKAAPGIDGWLDGQPVSLKRVGVDNPRALMRSAARAQASARKTGYSGVELVIHAEKLSYKQVIDFARNGSFGKIASAKGTIKQIYVKSKNGWVVLNG